MLHGLHARSAVQDGIEETNVENVNHTPGPWEALGLTIAESAGQHRDIAECFSCHEHTVEISEPEAEANARLIAAAPELFETVIAYRLHHKLMLNVTNDTDCPCKICQMAETVIRKAKA